LYLSIVAQRFGIAETAMPGNVVAMGMPTILAAGSDLSAGT